MFAHQEKTYAATALIAEQMGLSYGIVADVPLLVGRHAMFDECRWDPGAGPDIGGRFTGWIDADPGGSRIHQCEVGVALRGRRFMFATLDRATRWAFEFSAVRGYTRLTASCITSDGAAGIDPEPTMARLTRTVRSVKLYAETLALTASADVAQQCSR
jgi:hypothetical protein